MQLLIDLPNNEFDGGNCGQNKARILSAFSVSKHLLRAGYLTSGIKKVFNFLWYVFT